MDDPIVAPLPFWDRAIEVAEGLSRSRRASIQAACKRDIVRRYRETFTSFKPDYTIHFCGRVVDHGWVAHYIWQSDQEGGIYVLARPKDEEMELGQSQVPPKDADEAHLKLTLMRLSHRYRWLDAGGRGAMIARAVRSHTGANYISDRNLIAEAEDRLGMYGCLYEIQCDYEVSWYASLSDTWFPDDFQLHTGGGDECDVRGEMIVKYAYARSHPYMLQCWKEHYRGRVAPWAR